MLPKLRTKPITVATLITILALILAACAQASAPEKAADYAPPAPPMEAPRSDTGIGSYEAVSNNLQQSVERIVIKNASLTIVVRDPGKSMTAITQMAEDMGGFVVVARLDKQELDSGAKVPHASITIRVPAERLNDALAQIRAQSDQDPISESLDSQDVTSEYVDLQSRLRNLESTEAQLTKFMERAETTEDVLSVYNELVRVREQIELLKGQIKYYEESAALSAISTELMANEAIQPLTVGGWQPQGIVKSAIQALINTLKVLANILIWILLYVLPVLLVVYLVFFLPFSLLWRTWRRRRARNKPLAAQTHSAAAKPQTREELPDQLKTGEKTTTSPTKPPSEPDNQ